MIIKYLKLQNQQLIILILLLSISLFQFFGCWQQT